MIIQTFRYLKDKHWDYNFQQVKTIIMNLKDIQKALATLEEQKKLIHAAYKDKQLTRHQKLNDIIEVQDILLIIEQKIQERTKKQPN